MKTRTKSFSLLLLLFAAGVAQAAKVNVTWTNPTQNEDGSPLLNLHAIIIEWGSCNGTAFGTKQASITVMQNPVRVTRATIYPTGLSKVCVRAFAVTTNAVQSTSSGVASKALLPSTGKPVTLGTPIIITPEN